MKLNRLSLIPFAVEFISQFAHTFWGVMSTYSLDMKNQTLNSSSFKEERDYTENVLMPALQAGLSVWMQIVCFWNLSPAHFNPAISLGVMLSGSLHPINCIFYIIIQCVSSTFAAFVAQVIVGQAPSVILVPEEARTGSVFLNEALITGFLVFFVLCMTKDPNFSQATGAVAIGFTVFQGILSGNAIGVACISPSRAFGPAMVVGGNAWSRHWLLWFSDLFGASFVTVLYMTMFADEKINWLTKMGCGGSKKSKKSLSISEEDKKIIELEKIV